MKVNVVWKLSSLVFISGCCLICFLQLVPLLCSGTEWTATFLPLLTTQTLGFGTWGCGNKKAFHDILLSSPILPLSLFPPSPLSLFPFHFSPLSLFLFFLFFLFSPFLLPSPSSTIHRFCKRLVLAYSCTLTLNSQQTPSFLSSQFFLLRNQPQPQATSLHTCLGSTTWTGATLMSGSWPHVATTPPLSSGIPPPQGSLPVASRQVHSHSGGQETMWVQLEAVWIMQLLWYMDTAAGNG